MPRRRVPAVGTKGLHIAQLTPEVRSILRHRADAAAQRAYAPEIAADKQAIGAVRQGFQNERDSILGATDMAQDSLTQALRGLKSSGLSGRYLRQGVNELTARQGDVASSVPFLLADAAQERNEALTTARQELTDSRAARAKSGAEMFNSLLKEKRDEASSVLSERVEGGEGKFDPRALENADLALKDALTAWSKNVPVKIPGQEGPPIPVQEANPLRTIDDWRSFAKGLTDAYEGFDYVDVMEVVKRFLRRRQEHHEEGTLNKRELATIFPQFNAGG